MMMRISLTAAPFALFFLAAGPALATSITLNPDKDNTLIQTSDGSLSNALGDIYVGRTGQSDSISRRRGVISFDVAGSVPAGATITSAKLRLYLNRTVDSTSRTISIYDLSASWGEGTSYFDGGVGAASTTNDATWLHRFYSATSWSSAGSDFNATARQSCSVGTTYQYYEWTSNSNTIADAQSWLDTPSTNYGWLVKEGESTSGNARRFTSGEGTSLQLPELVITYTVNGFAPRSFWARAAHGQDVTGDGIADTVWHNLQTGELRVQWNGGSTSVPVGTLSPSSVTRGVRDLGAGPVLLVVDGRTGDLTSVPLGSTRAAPATLVQASLALRLVNVADVDADGHDDLIVRDATGQLYAASASPALGGATLKGALLPSGHSLDGL